MPHSQPRTRRRFVAAILAVLVVALLVLTCAKPALAIPAFARKYEMSCIVCHVVFPKLTQQGEAFRRNGYQFPVADELFVKSEQLALGSDAWKDMWPNSIWPSEIPGMPPLFLRSKIRMYFHTDPANAGDKRWDMDFPHDLDCGGAGTLRKDISFWAEVEWEPKDHDSATVKRVFLQFSNLFAWDEMDDDDGMRMGHRWLTLPPHAMNLKIGKFDTGVLMPVLSQNRRIGIQQAVPIRQRMFANRFRFEPVQSAAVELNGIIRQYNSYAVGFANGGMVSGEHLDDNTNKDVYFRVARKWFGYPLDGEIGSVKPAGQASSEPPPSADELGPPGLDFWRECGFETGVFGWWGKAEIPAETITVLNSLPVVGDPLDFRTDTIYPGRSDYFRRIGVDARFQWFDLDLYGMAYWGRDTFAGRASGVDLGIEDHFSWFAQADYMCKPWLLVFLRYDQTTFNEVARAGSEETKVTPGAVLVFGPNLVLRSEWVLDARGNRTGGSSDTNRMAFQLDYAF